jgi:hypothetical protein
LGVHDERRVSWSGRAWLEGKRVEEGFLGFEERKIARKGEFLIERPIRRDGNKRELEKQIFFVPSKKFEANCFS